MGTVNGKGGFNLRQAIADAKSGKLRGAELRRAIKKAEDLGKTSEANELKLQLVDPYTFKADGAPADVCERVAKGVSYLRVHGRSLSRTTQMLKKHGVIGTIERVAQYSNDASRANTKALVDAGLARCTSEAIILDYPHLFSVKARAKARDHLPGWKGATSAETGRRRDRLDQRGPAVKRLSTLSGL
jgi:hypothetical protein